MMWWLSIASLITATSATGQDSTPKGNGTLAARCDATKKKTVDGNNLPTGVECIADPAPFKGLKLGTGIVFTPSLGGTGTAALDANKIVRVSQQNVSAARLAFELHYYFAGTNNSLSFTGHNKDCSDGGLVPVCVPAGSWGTGPFVSLNSKPIDNLSSGGTAFSSIGIGWMIGVSDFAGGGSGNHSLNFGVGLLVDTKVNQLTAGVHDGQTTTVDPAKLNTSVTKYGPMALLSYSFALN